MKLQTGDIFAVKGKGFFAFLNRKLIKPYTDRFHFGLLGDYIPEEDDWVILESINKGVAVGRLSFYDLNDVEFYRINDVDSAEKGTYATIQATLWGREKYDYRLFIKLIYYALKALIKYHSIWYTDIPNIEDKRLICTELVDEAYRFVFPVFDARYEATPSHFKERVREGYIIKL